MIAFLIIVNILLLLCNIFFIAVVILNKKGIRIPDIKLKKYTISLSGGVEKEDYKAAIEETKREVSRVSNIQKKLVPKIQEGFNHLSNTSKKLSSRIDAIENQLNQQEDKEAYMPEVPPVELIIDIPPVNESKIYLKNFKEGILSECRESEAQFCSTNINDSQISFNFCGDMAAAIATKDATFDDVCELIGWQSNVRSLYPIADGTARKYSEGKWKVEKQAQIKCE